jgi:hypothetical protein
MAGDGLVAPQGSVVYTPGGDPGGVAVHQAADESGRQKLPAWPPPPGGMERLLTESRWQRHRRPFTRRQIILSRITVLVAAILAAVVVSIEPLSSLWWHAAVGGLSGLAVSLASSSPYQIGQLLGLRPPSPRQRG